jgi:hypothetical protein
MSKRIVFAVSVGVLLVAITYGQGKKNLELETPKWVKMMYDPNCNYFQTLEEFRNFWKGKALPEEPFEDQEMDVFEREVGLIANEKEHSAREVLEELARKAKKLGGLNTRSYAMEVRAFKGWMQDVKPWVREDGSIIGLIDQQKIIDQQQAELKQIEKQNKR